MNAHLKSPVISGIGIVSAIGQGKEDFVDALMRGAHAFSRMSRPGRLAPVEDTESSFLGAEIDTLAVPERLSRRALRTASFSGQAAAATVHEAWEEARLESVDPERIGLVVGGSNIQQRELVQTYGTHAGRGNYLRPSYASSFMDTDLCGICSELFGIRGPAYTVGAASASGQLAVIRGALAVQSGEVDVCIALGALMDISYWECRAFRSAGAMGSDRFAERPAEACRPFDWCRDGFIYGEACAAIVIERAETAREREVVPYAELNGWAIVSDANRGTDPSRDGEIRVMQKALCHAGLEATDIDYVNPHGSGSRLGDEVELRAIRACGLSHARINATKALTGHSLTAAGAVEVAATVLQMRAGKLHPTRNLEEPIDPELNWTGPQPVTHTIRQSLSLSLGFGGINTALCLRHL